MDTLAVTYLKLGRHAEALTMQESVLKFRRRLLPENHSDICRGMSGVMCCM